MNKFWLVCRYEFLRHVRRKRFIFALLSMPIFVAALVGIGYLAVAADYDGRPIGYIDQSGVLNNARQIPPEKDLLFPPPEIRAFTSVDQARRALQDGTIQAMFILDPTYMKTGKVQLVVAETMKDQMERNFRAFLRYNLVGSQPVDISTRILEGAEITVQAPGSQRQMAENESINILVPMVAGILFLMAINTSGSYLVQALVEEKENRTMEIVVTSLSPAQLMTGKIVGNVGVGLAELFAWIIFGVIGVAIARQYIPGAESLRLDPSFLLLMVITILPAFIMIAALMAIAGVTTTESREAQQVASLFTLPVVLPFFLIANLIEAPNSPLAVTLSFFPLTAPIVLPLRAAFTDVPAWQVAVIVGLTVVCAVGAFWLAGRAFRLGMLRYGKKLALREIFRKV